MFVRCARPLAVYCGLVAVALFLCGCPTPPKPAPRITHIESPAASAPVIAVIPPVEPAPAQPPATVPAPLLEKRGILPPVEKLQLPGGMLPVSAWAELCGFTEVRPLPNANPPALELLSPEGKLMFFLGQRFAKWNGINLGLGFAPMPRNGQFTVNSIDVAKNAYPLGLGRFMLAKSQGVLVLDPGHGGADPGSRCTGRNSWEKDLTLDWALRVERLLAGSNWRVVLTRRDDRDVPLLERVALADANNADVFISLHFNALEKNGSAREEAGIETFCLTPAGAPSNINRTFEDDTRLSFPNNEFDAQNLLLATRLQSSLIKTTGRRDRGVRRARFMTVVREQKRPAVLIEGGFLSNPSEANLILQASFREKMAQAVCNALPN